MMPILIETPQRGLMPQRPRAEAARLLEELREAYQTLAPSGRGLIRVRLANLARVQLTVENDWEK